MKRFLLDLNVKSESPQAQFWANKAKERKKIQTAVSVHFFSSCNLFSSIYRKTETNILTSKHE